MAEQDSRLRALEMEQESVNIAYCGLVGFGWVGLVLGVMSETPT